MIHKFRDMPANLNTRRNIYVLIDEAHRTTGGDLGNFLMAGLPNATFIGFTGTPVVKTVYGKGTFKTFGCEDDQGYRPRVAPLLCSKPWKALEKSNARPSWCVRGT